MDEPRITSPVIPPSLGPKLNPNATKPAGLLKGLTEDRSQTSVAQTTSQEQPDIGTVGNQILQSLSQLLPVEVLKSFSLTKAEWAWRMVLVDELFGRSGVKNETSDLSMTSDKGTSTESAVIDAGDAGAPEVQRESQNQGAVLKTSAQATQNAAQVARNGQSIENEAENTVSLWWNFLDNLERTVQRENSRNTWFGSLPEDQMVPFARLSSENLSGASLTQVKEVLADRLVSAVVTENGIHFGAGLFVPPQENPASIQKTVVRWRGERQNKVNRHGQLVCRLSLKFEIQQWPVEVVFLSARPSLQVYIRTNHPKLKNAAASPDSALDKNLKEAGWQIDRWAVSPLTEERSES